MTLETVSRIFAGAGVIFLTIAGIILAIGHSPESSANFYAEALATPAYYAFALSVFIFAVERLYLFVVQIVKGFKG